jgi:hypothetical protein
VNDARTPSPSSSSSISTFSSSPSSDSSDISTSVAKVGSGGVSVIHVRTTGRVFELFRYDAFSHDVVVERA